MALSNRRQTSKIDVCLFVFSKIFSQEDKNTLNSYEELSVFFEKYRSLQTFDCRNGCIIIWLGVDVIYIFSIGHSVVFV